MSITRVVAPLKALYRAHSSKRLVAKLVRKRDEERTNDARMWEEMWSEDAQAWFYHNAENGACTAVYPAVNSVVCGTVTQGFERCRAFRTHDGLCKQEQAVSSSMHVENPVRCSLVMRPTCM